jgi:hypothetical protein
VARQASVIGVVSGHAAARSNWRRSAGRGSATMTVMLFAAPLTIAAPASAAEWIGGACRGSSWTVGALVPNGNEHYVRVHAQDPNIRDWWFANRQLFEDFAEIGLRHTSSAGCASYAVWEGHGFDQVAKHLACVGPIDDTVRRELDQERARLREEDRRRNEVVRVGLGAIPRFELSGRTYYLFNGTVTAVSHLRHPGSPEDWRNPDLFWPADRRWFVATDVDFRSLYTGGSDDFITELVAGVPTPTALVSLNRPLESEDCTHASSRGSVTRRGPAWCRSRRLSTAGSTFRRGGVGPWPTGLTDACVLDRQVAVRGGGVQVPSRTSSVGR